MLYAGADPEAARTRNSGKKCRKGKRPSVPNNGNF